MSCERFQEGLDDFLAGRLSDVERRAAEEHLAACAGCRALADTLRAALGVLGPDALRDLPGAESPELAAAIVARTSGTACGRVQDLLADLVDGRLPAGEAQLANLHLERCERCAALQRALVWLRDLLPQMAAIEPDAALAPAVARRIAALQAAEAPRSRVADVRRALAERWQRLVARPRFAWEAAYVGLVTIVLLCGTPVSPLRGVPQRALAVVQVDPVAAASTAFEQGRVLHGGIGALGARAWEATGGRAAGGVRARGAAYAANHPGMSEAWAGMSRHADELGVDLRQGNLAGASLALSGLNENLRAFWRSWRAAQPDASPAARAPGDP